AEVVGHGAADGGEGAVAAVVRVLGRDKEAVSCDLEEVVEDLGAAGEGGPLVPDYFVLAAPGREVVLHRLDRLAEDLFRRQCIEEVLDPSPTVEGAFPVVLAVRAGLVVDDAEPAGRDAVHPVDRAAQPDLVPPDLDGDIPFPRPELE